MSAAAPGAIAEVRWRANMPFGGDPRPAWERIREIRERFRGEGGEETLAKLIVEDARSSSSPLHRFFDWDVRAAAEKHWESIARRLNGAFDIEIVSVGGGTVRVPDAILVERPDGAGQIRDVIETDAALREQLDGSDASVDRILDQALRDYDSLRRRYEAFSQLREINDAIARAVSKHARGRAAKRRTTGNSRPKRGARARPQKQRT